MRQQVLGQRLEGIDHVLAVEIGVLSHKPIRCSLDLVQIVGNPPMVGLQFVDHRIERRVGMPEGREQKSILDPVVRVHEAAVMEAGKPELPQRAVGLQRPNLGSHLVRQSAGTNSIGKLPHRVEIVTNHAVYP